MKEYTAENYEKSANLRNTQGKYAVFGVQADEAQQASLDFKFGHFLYTELGTIFLSLFWIFVSQVVFIQGGVFPSRPRTASATTFFVELCKVGARSVTGL